VKRLVLHVRPPFRVGGLRCQGRVLLLLLLLLLPSLLVLLRPLRVRLRPRSLRSLD
jgi:hypothetical protein